MSESETLTMFEKRHGITVFKLPGSMHAKDITEFWIDFWGLRIGKPSRNLTGIFAGKPTLCRAKSSG